MNFVTLLVHGYDKSGKQVLIPTLVNVDHIIMVQPAADLEDGDSNAPSYKIWTTDNGHHACAGQIEVLANLLAAKAAYPR